MDITVRPVVADELPGYLRVDRIAFHDPDSTGSEPVTAWQRHELERTRAAFDGDEIVATGRNYSLGLALPGGATLPFGGVSWVSTLPTHRRRGLLRAIMSELIDDGRERGEATLGLHASESSIYGRFGFGTATQASSFEVETARAAFRRPVAAQRLRAVDDGEARDLLPALHDRWWASMAGEVSRPAEWWPDEYFDVSGDPAHRACGLFHVVHERGGTADGYLSYSVEPRWIDHHARTVAVVRELAAPDPETRLALWRYVLDLDLVDRVVVDHVPLDEPLRWVLADSRRLVVRQVADRLWLRPLDVAALLSARTYAASGRVVVAVTDPAFGVAEGRFELEVDEAGAPGRCRPTKSAPDLALGVAELGAAYLGGVRWAVLGRAGLVDEERPGALATADRLFACDPLPFTATSF
jgi:predicted acetyltransferase